MLAMLAVHPLQAGAYSDYLVRKGKNKAKTAHEPAPIIADRHFFFFFFVVEFSRNFFAA